MGCRCLPKFASRARRKKFLSLLEQGSVFKDDDVHRVQTLEEMLRPGQLFPKPLAYNVRPGSG